jgi:hypothetical protein
MLTGYEERHGYCFKLVFTKDFYYCNVILRMLWAARATNAGLNFTKS